MEVDGATCHIVDVTSDILHVRFEGRVMSLQGVVIWPVSSCDLIPLDIFLCDFFKSQVYARKPQSTDVLKGNISNRSIRQSPSRLCYGRIRKMLFSVEKAIHEILLIPHIYLVLFSIST